MKHQRLTAPQTPNESLESRKVHLKPVPQGPPEILGPPEPMHWPMHVSPISPEPIQAEADDELSQDSLESVEIPWVTWLPPFRTETEAAALAAPWFPDYDELPWFPPDDFNTNSYPDDD